MDKDSPDLQYHPWSKIKNPAMLGQYFGFGVAEEWRIQSAFWEGPEIFHSVASMLKFEQEAAFEKASR